ncbi:MAG: hypothetical protein HZA04_00410 [Nitrospinae bacterium]|nr:hypothetical protein [Nitrospinota bacterium]
MERNLIENDFTVAVTFRHNMRPVEYRCNHLELRVGDTVVVDSERGAAIATVERSRMKAKGRCCTRQIRNVIRKATPHDLEVDKRNSEKEQAIYRAARQKISDGELRMKLSHAEMSFDEKRAILYFTSEDRVDFRDMVKSLAAEMNVRIEMRQVGVRDEARILGGCGICGFKLCCSSFLPDFMPVSIRMAKDQNLSLNPTKISGVCGRLMCCLMYEQDFYKEMQKTVPRTGKTVITPEGRGKVLVADFLRSRVTVMVEGDKGIMTFEAAQVQPAYPTQPQGKPRQGGQRQRQERPRPDDRPVDKPVDQAVQEALEENGNGDDEPAE